MQIRKQPPDNHPDHQAKAAQAIAHPLEWNVRDTHMADTLERLMKQHGTNSKVIVWAHNTHVGDARQTDVVESGMTNLGQLTWKRLSEQKVFLVGFGTNHGKVIPGAEWDAPLQVMDLPDAMTGSILNTPESTIRPACRCAMMHLFILSKPRLGIRFTFKNVSRIPYPIPSRGDFNKSKRS